MVQARPSGWLSHYNPANHTFITALQLSQHLMLHTSTSLRAQSQSLPCLGFIMVNWCRASQECFNLISVYLVSWIKYSTYMADSETANEEYYSNKSNLLKLEPSIQGIVLPNVPFGTETVRRRDSVAKHQLQLLIFQPFWLEYCATTNRNSQDEEPGFSWSSQYCKRVYQSKSASQEQCRCNK